MYAPEIVDKRLKKIAAQKKIDIEYHSIKQVDEANAHFAEFLKKDDFNPETDLDQEEKEWIRNERILCMCDYRYWLSRYCWLVDKTNNLVRFRPYKAQQIIIQIRGELEKEGRSLEFQNLKARQLGVSTESEFAVAHRVQFYSHINAVIGSSDPDKSEEMSRMMETNWGNQPWFLLPEMTVRKAGVLFEFGNQHSRVSIQHGTQFSGIARGTTPTICHLSELADFEDPKELIDASLFRAVHSSPWVLIILESTAKGRHNWWHETWRYSVENWASGMARLKPIFLPWFVSDDIYPTPTEARTRAVPDGWQPPQLVIKHAEKCEAAAKADPLLRKYLGDNWKMPLEKMWWWWYTRSEYAAKKELAQFYSECAATPEEAFQNDTTSVFDVDLISSYRDACPDPHVFGLIGPQSQIPYRIWPDRRDFNNDKPRIEIEANWSSNGKALHYELVPLKFEGYSNFDPDKKLLIYEWPEDNEEYGYGCDTAEGIGLDRTVVEVVRKGNLIKNDKQVAEFASHWVSAFDIWPFLMAIGTLYSTVIRGRLKQCRSVIECRGNGENAQFELKKRGWRNFHPWLRYDTKRIHVDKAHRLGWFTNSWSRDMLTDQLIKALRDAWIDVCSPYFVDEMADFQKDEYAQSLRATHGGHDDRIMALGMAFLSMHILEVRGTGKSIIEQRMAARDQSTEYEEYDPGPQGRDMDLERPGRKSVRIGARY